MQSNSWIQEFWVAVSNNLNYDSSLSLSVSVKVIPKFQFNLVLLFQTVVGGGNKWNCLKTMC